MKTISKIPILPSDQRNRRTGCRRYSQSPVAGLAALALFLAGASRTEAQSDDEKVFPGTMCVHLGAKISTGTSLRYGGRGEVVNQTSRPVTVVCPIVRDKLRADYISLDVVVTDQNPDQNVNCAAHSFGGGNLANAQVTNPLPDGFLSRALQTLRFAPLPRSDPRASYFITCDIPPAVSDSNDRIHFSAVVSYHIMEFE